MPTKQTSEPSSKIVAAILAALPNLALFLLFFLAAALTHLTLLRLPYYWDEGGYYIPAALDFYHRWTLIPEFSNAHPPLPSIILGLLWHLVGFHIVATRLCVCAFAAAALLAIFRMASRLLDGGQVPLSGLTVAVLTALYPIWFAQSTLAHADIFAAAFTLWAFNLYLTRNTSDTPPSDDLHLVELKPPAAFSLWHSRQARVAILFTLAVLCKETAIIQPATLAAIELYLILRSRTHPSPRNTRHSGGWLAALSFPLLPLLAWYVYHHHKTGFTFGNPEYLRYNATANLTTQHIYQALYYRFLHLAWQRNIWLPICFAILALILNRRPDSLSPKSWPLSRGPWTLTPDTLTTIAILVAANWIAFSILGGALLTRYLLPIYPLILMVCVSLWRSRARNWLLMAALTAAAFIAGLWLDPPTAFAPEDNLTYRDMIVVHQQAIAFVDQHYPQATILTAWPVAADVFRPELGYTNHRFTVVSLESFSLPDIQKAATEPDRYDTAIVFTQHYVSPPFLQYLLNHPNSLRGKAFAKDRDLSPKEIAATLHGTIVWQNDIDGEWAAVLRFNRSYEAQLALPHNR